MYKYLCSFHFISFFFPFKVFRCTKCKFVLVLRTFFFFKHKLHAGQILNFSRYLSKGPKTLEIDWNDSKFFQSEIGIPWTKFLESPLPSGTYGHKEECACYSNWKTKKGGPKCPWWAKQNMIRNRKKSLFYGKITIYHSKLYTILNFTC